MVFTPFRFLTCIVTLCLLMAASSQAAPLFSVTALPSNTTAYGINNAGQIVGDFYSDTGRRGFLWSPGGFELLGTLGGADSTATAINNLGQVTGYSTADDGVTRAFLYSGGAMTTLQQFGGAHAVGLAINDAGEVAGQYFSGSDWRAFLHTGGDGLDLGDLGGGFAYAAGINNHGEVVGSSDLNDDAIPTVEAFLYSGGSMQSLGSLGGSRAEALDINNLRQAVGWGWVNGSEHAFLHDGAVMNDLGTLGGRRSYANAINDLGIIVGESDLAGDEARVAFIYMDGLMTDLNTLIDPAEGWTLYSASAINDASQIAAYGCRGDECGAVLLEVVAHVPEPGAGLLTLTGLVLLGLYTRRQRSMSIWRIPSSS